MPTIYSPFIYWGQTESSVSLRVDLKSVKHPNLDLQSDKISFYAYGYGARGFNDYSFSFDFFADVVPQKSHYRIIDRHVEFFITKKEAKLWPRLCQSTIKPHWLKVDFDKLETNDTEEEDMEDDLRKSQNYFRNLPDKDFGRRRKSQLNPEEFRKVYLFLFNMFSFVGFIYVLVVLIIRYAKEGPESMAGSYKALGRVMKFLHLMQILEVLHPLLGYTRGEFKIPSLQIGFRLFMIFIMIDSEPRLQTKPVVFYLFLIYSMMEVIKYPYYMLRVFRVDIAFLTWLRYTIWIPLYPLTFICEGVILLRNIPYFDETGRYSIFLPNQLNFSFHLPTFIRLYLLTGFFPFMWLAMNRLYYQRVRMIGPKKWKKEFAKAD